MKILAIIFLVMYIIMFLFAKVDSTGLLPIWGILYRVIVCLVASAIVTIIIGLPILGIVFLVIH
nr:MAG TPA: hypothetical protein [Caudoviricetes sp.]